MANYDSNYAIAQLISARLGNEPIPFDSVYSICLLIYQELGGVEQNFDSVYSILLEILPLVDGGISSKVIDDSVISLSKTWSSSKISTELADAGFDVEIVQSLPATGDSHTIYFMLKQDSSTGDVYNEWMYIDGNWELVGNTQIDLSDYATINYVDEQIETLIGNANSEIDGKETEDFTFVQTLPAEGEEDQLVIIKGDNADTLYKYVSGEWVEQTPDANILYFDVENEALYSYVTAQQQFAPISLVNTIVVGSNLNNNADLKALKTPGVYSVVQRLHNATKGDYVKNWTLYVESVDYEEYDKSDSVYQRLVSNYTIQKRTWSATRATNDGWSSFSTYYAGEIKDSTVSKYYTWSSSKLNTSLGAKQDVLTAGQNIAIDASNNISADGYVYNASDGSFVTKYLNIDEDESYIATNTASGEGAFAEGYGTTATGMGSHAEGGATQATGSQCAHAEGLMTVASGKNSHAEGNKSVASGQNSHAEGAKLKNQNPTTAAGSGSHAEGQSTLASGQSSHAEGELTEAKNGVEHAQGQCNVSHTDSVQTMETGGKTIHSIGIGHTLGNVPQRKNAVEVMYNGDHYILGIGNYDGVHIKGEQGAPANTQTLQDVVNGKADAADLSSYATLAYVDSSLALKADVYETATLADILALFAEPAPPTPSQPNDELWYTTSDGEIILIGGGSGSGSGSGGSGSGSGSGGGWPQVLSNTYEDGKGVIKFAEDLTEIPFRGFLFKETLTSIEIPNNVTSIGDEAFRGCFSLTSITISNNVTSIGDEAFHNCTGLTSVTIPNSVTSIGESAFQNCTGLKSVTIPNSVTSIGNSAFSGCSSLKSVTIPNSVTSIGELAFYECHNLTNISYTGTISQWYAIDKGPDWHLDVPATVVHCTDGDVNL